MLRITVLSGCGSAIHLKVEGRRAEDWGSEPDYVTRAWLSQDKQLILDLSNVTFVDPCIRPLKIKKSRK